MRCWMTALTVVVSSVTAFAQAVPTRIAGITEPSELTGEAKKVVVPTAAERQFFGKAVASLDPKDSTKLKVAVDALSEFVQLEPDYSDAYLMRAMAQCFLNGANVDSILDDVAKAISTHSTSTRTSVFFTLADHYAFRAKVEFDAGQYREAMDDLDAAIKQDISAANKVFGSGGVEPDTAAVPCTWSKPNLDVLVRRFPADYRVYLYRALCIGCDIRSVRISRCAGLQPGRFRLAGHQDLTTTQRYMHLSPAAIDSAIRLLDAPGVPPARGNMVATDQQNPGTPCGRTR
jgi:tetratricopeptide (TPR) repeat protein